MCCRPASASASSCRFRSALPSWTPSTRRSVRCSRRGAHHARRRARHARDAARGGRPMDGRRSAPRAARCSSARQRGQAQRVHRWPPVAAGPRDVHQLGAAGGGSRFRKLNDPVGDFDGIQRVRAGLHGAHALRRGHDGSAHQQHHPARHGHRQRRAVGQHRLSGARPRFGTGFKVEIPDGTPARCNPLIAPRRVATRHRESGTPRCGVGGSWGRGSEEASKRS